MDYDVEVLGLQTPASSSPLTTYRPALSVRNNGLFPAIANGELSAYKAGLRVYHSLLTSALIQPGETANATAADDWLPDSQGDYFFFGSVSTYRDQNPSNGNLPPTRVTVGPPPPPPQPKTLDDIYAALQPLGTEATLEQIKAAVPAAPATEPTLVDVRDQVTSAAKEDTLLLIGNAIGDAAKEVTQLDVNYKLESRLPPALGTDGGLKVDGIADVNSKLESRLPPALGLSGGLKVEGIVSTPPAKAPTQFETLGSRTCTQTPIELVFALQTRVILIQADPQNTGNILVGGQFVNPSGEHALCKLTPGDSIAIEYNDRDNPLYVCASIAPSFAIVGATTEP
jgi:hypothetical protein